MEQVYLTEYSDFDDAYRRIETFIEDVYNRKRSHSSLGCLPPVEFEEKLQAKPKHKSAPVGRPSGPLAAAGNPCRSPPTQSRDPLKSVHPVVWRMGCTPGPLSRAARLAEATGSRPEDTHDAPAARPRSSRLGRTSTARLAPRCR